MNIEQVREYTLSLYGVTDDLLQMANNTIRQMKSDGTLRSLHEKYGLVYAY